MFWKSVRVVAVAMVVVLGGGCHAPAPPPPQPSTPSQFRAYWVDAFGEGLYSPEQIDKLVAAAKAANMNAIIAQVGRRGDCFCNNAAMPRTEQAGVVPAPFDPLQTLIEKAHAEGLEVHAWIITTAMWNSSTPPKDPNHVFNLHGSSKTGADNWLGVRYDGVLRETTSAAANWFFDPGHPDAAEYIVEMYTSVARNYDVDGLNFDRVRYPDGQMTAWPNDNTWGYNPVALARFHAATGRNDRPLPDDLQWQQWRRDQITNIVRRVYLETYAIKPQIRISADTITYDYGPQNPKWGSWERSRPYREVLQDWRAWMQEGILDLNILMNYKREHCTADGTGCFGNQRLMFEEWNEFAKDHQYERQAAIGPALYLNTIANSVAQVRKVLAPGSSGKSVVGWAGYSYRVPDDRANLPTSNPQYRSGDASRAELTRAFTESSEYDTDPSPVFSTPATVPAMPWKMTPTKGHLRGTLSTAGGVPFDQVKVDLYDAETDAHVGSKVTDGSGWFGFVDLQPGRYNAIVDDARVSGRHVAVVEVSAGQLATVAVTPFASGEEGRRPLQVSHPTRESGETVELLEKMGER
ncbi:glycoside hydrolase family 10 protein [Archangium sp.]|uniref:glycoside hydrolase family 10 protein n=1 Tax=Archangium sp. TaxID=1872627 RepID=UPI002D2573D7|nr:family 10 glycosylhydrolase [Archangium sp.]HYO55519.1 family 10 glycosylhydrolase [Archangium sp.]